MFREEAITISFLDDPAPEAEDPTPCTRCFSVLRQFQTVVSIYHCQETDRKNTAKMSQRDAQQYARAFAQHPNPRGWVRCLFNSTGSDDFQLEICFESSRSVSMITRHTNATRRSRGVLHIGDACEPIIQFKVNNKYSGVYIEFSLLLRNFLSAECGPQIQILDFRATGTKKQCPETIVPLIPPHRFHYLQLRLLGIQLEHLLM